MVCSPHQPLLGYIARGEPLMTQYQPQPTFNYSSALVQEYNPFKFGENIIKPYGNLVTTTYNKNNNLMTQDYNLAPKYLLNISRDNLVDTKPLDKRKISQKEIINPLPEYDAPNIYSLLPKQQQSNNKMRFNQNKIIPNGQSLMKEKIHSTDLVMLIKAELENLQQPGELQQCVI